MLKDEIARAVKSSVDVDSVRVMVREEVQRTQVDMEDREGRKANIIIYNVPEGEEEDGSEHDDLIIQQLLQTQMKIQGGKKGVITRLGEKSERPRPLRLALETEKDKKEVLRSTNRLRGAPVPFSRMSLRADMSQEDRLQHKAIVEEAKLRTENESGDWIHLVRGVPGRWKILRVQRRT